MQIFISWSGQKSRAVAQALADFVPSIIQSARPFLADTSVGLGQRWEASITSAITKAEAAVICLTKDNVNSPWIAYETGLMSGKLGTAKLFPLLIDLSARELNGPFAQFQTLRLERGDMLRMFQSMNRFSIFQVSESVLDKTFQSMWPSFENRTHNFVEPDTSKHEDATMQSILKRIQELEMHYQRTLKKDKDS